ncbi:MAG: hypothetical protein B7Z33_13335 [Sphingomonadales bacterium 12-68-11]|nr:MAG: hypothetical protein B7Z33_13335 [Sphingomonadales bacterium 12-68-11]OYX16774.1 MAG: hypothetical protein B7Z07_02010 [Sphingomonadales bacterium 32-67-7]
MRALLRDQRGATAVEYGLILALIVLAMLGALQLFATESIGMWTRISDSVDGVM